MFARAVANPCPDKVAGSICNKRDRPACTSLPSVKLRLSTIPPTRARTSGYGKHCAARNSAGLNLTGRFHNRTATWSSPTSFLPIVTNWRLKPRRSEIKGEGRRKTWHVSSLLFLKNQKRVIYPKGNALTRRKEKYSSLSLQIIIRRCRNSCEYQRLKDINTKKDYTLLFYFDAG